MSSDKRREVGIDSVKVRRERLSEQVAFQLQQLIIQGRLKPGDRLPPERELVKQLGVSRTVIREATKALQERGLVRVLTGNGTYASKVNPQVVSQSIGLFFQGYRHAFRDLLEIRKSLEVEMAGLAALRATEAHIELLETALATMRAVLPNIHDDAAQLEQFVHADILFHQVLAQASANSLLPLLLTPITDLLTKFSREASTLPGAPESAVRHHQTILECVRGRNSLACRLAMHEHISNAEGLIELMEEGKWDPESSSLDVEVGGVSSTSK